MNYFRILPNGFIKIFEGSKMYTIFKSSKQIDDLRASGFIEIFSEAIN